MRFKFRQGYAEVRMRVPRGNIYWPAFWLVGAGDGSIALTARAWAVRGTMAP